MTRITLATANLYVANRVKGHAADTLAGMDFDVVGTQEGWWLHDLPGYMRARALHGHDRHHIQNAVWFRDRYRYEGHGAYRVTDEIPGDKFAPERWIVWARMLVDGHPICAIDTHVNAQIQRRTTGAMRTGPRVDQARRHMQRLGAEIRRQQSAGFDVVAMLDSNYAKRGQRRLWRWSPHRTFARCGLTYYARHIDGVAVPRGSRVLASGPFDIPGSNHRGLQLTVDIPRRRPTN